jgi:hypothetical protein
MRGTWRPSCTCGYVMKFVIRDKISSSATYKAIDDIHKFFSVKEI